jgi:hypothetical protein
MYGDVGCTFEQTFYPKAGFCYDGFGKNSFSKRISKSHGGMTRKLNE